MKKTLIFLLTLLLATPYLFLLSDVKDVPNTDKKYNCIISKVRYEKRNFGLGSVYYSTGFFTGNKRIILPYFFVKGDMTYANCEGREVLIGVLGFDGYKVGTKMNLYTKEVTVSVLGLEVIREESIKMFGTGWFENKEI